MGTPDAAVKTAIADEDMVPIYALGQEMATQRESLTDWANSPLLQKAALEALGHSAERIDAKLSGEQYDTIPLRAKTPVCRRKKTTRKSPRNSSLKPQSPFRAKTDKWEGRYSLRGKTPVFLPQKSPPPRPRTPMCEVPKKLSRESTQKGSPSAESESPRNDTVAAKKCSLRHGIGIMDEHVERILAELEYQEWYHGFLPFEDIIGLLHKNGDFLIRALDPVGEKPPVPCVTVKWDQVIDHPIRYRVKGENRLFTLDGNFRNPGIIDLVKFHKESGTPIGQGVKLINPIPKQKWELTRDKITLGEKIGEGNFSEVFEGTLHEGSTAPPIDVAIKKTKVNAENKYKISEMYKEARLMRQYKHRNIVAFYGIVDDGSVDVMIVMELVHGGPLDEYIRKNPELSSEIRFAYAGDVACALLYLHNKKCLHRDVACRNCLLDEDQNRVKLSDFGLSKHGDSYKIPKEENTPIRWQAPEVLKTRIYTAKSDVFSYGILVWEIFHHAQKPYGDVENKVIREKINDPQFRPAVDSKLPKEVKLLMESCWKADPEKRPTAASIVAYIRSKTKSRSKEQSKQKTKARSPSSESDKHLLTQQIKGVNGLMKTCEKTKTK